MLRLKRDRFLLFSFFGLFTFSAFGSGFFSTYFGFSTGKFYIFCLILSLFYFFKEVDYKYNDKIVILSLSFPLIVLMLISINVGGAENIIYSQSVYFYIIAFTVLFISSRWDLFYKIGIFVIYLNFPILIYEIYTGSYIVNSSADFGPEYGRVKGIFEYSKMLGYFCIILGLLCYRRMSIFTLSLVLFSAILSGSRLAIIPILIVFVVKLISSLCTSSNIKIKLFSIISIVVSFLFLFVYLNYNSGSEIILSRLSNAFSMTSSSNSDRIFYWLQHLNVLNERGLLEILFGMPGNAYLLVGNGSESTYIHLLLEGGVVSLLIYLLGFTSLIWCLFLKDSVIHEWTSFLGVILLICCFQISRLGLSVIDGTYFWAFVFYCYFSRREDVR